MAQPFPRPVTSAAPRWRTLAGLAAAVSGLHLWGLGAVPTVAGAADTEVAAPTAAIEITRVDWVTPSPTVVTPQKPRVRTEPGTTARPARPARPAHEPQASPGEASAPLPDAVQVAQADKAPAPAARAAAPPAVVLPPSQPPASTRLTYDIEGIIKGLSYRASSTFEWKLEGGRYEARTDMSMFLVGSRVQTSVGSVGPGGLMPERFSDKRRSEVATHFERGAGRIRFSGNAPEAVLMPGAQDRLSLFMQLAGLLQARPHAAGDVIDFQVAGTGDAEPWRFEVGELQDLDLPAGTVSARWVRRLPRKPHDSTVEMWLAPSMNHLPVRLRISQANGDVADQRLARLP